RLMAPDMFNGWGVRTMSAGDEGYNPIEYHNGTVWPHDTGLIAEGFRRYGFCGQASALAMAIIESAGFFEYRLPEGFAGFSGGARRCRVASRAACRPQAWSAGAPLLAMRTVLGLDPIDHDLRASPALPAAIRELRLRGVQFRGARRDVP